MTGTRTDHIVSVRDFAIGHHREQAILSRINLTVDRGEMVALIGRNGSGKTTLLKSMIGLLAPLEGSCLLDGRPLEEFSLPQRSRQVSFVSSQLIQLPSLTVKELVSLGRMPYTGWTGRLSSQDRLLVSQALGEVQMEAFSERKLDCLSDGERQRALIARAFVQDTSLMVLDEPTAFLDIPNTFDLIRLLRRFVDAGRSIVYSTHDLETALHCADKLWVIHNGEILEGAPEDLGLSGLFSELFASSGIRYNTETGRFLVPGRSRGKISLEGEQGEPGKWTRNALERLGFQISEKQALNVRIESTSDGLYWTCAGRSRTRRFDSLHSLARFLIHD
jgi:iron complex transport system ATP-binding protein